MRSGFLGSSPSPAAGTRGVPPRVPFGFLLLGLGCAVLAGCAPPAARPNILLITVDTLRADHLEPYGYPRPTSPAIAELASGAIVFEAAQAQSSWTLPSLASLMTGTYPSNHGVVRFDSRLETSYTTLAERLRSAGYDTAAVANHVFLARPYGFHQGFTHYDDGLVREAETIGMHRTVTSESVTDRSLEWLHHKAAARDAGRPGPPWLLWAHYFDPHNEYRFHAGASEPFGAPGGSDLDLYDGEIAFTDRALGRLLDQLGQSGFAENTIVVLVADHGEAFGEHGRVHHSETLYQELIHVPLILRVPGEPARRVSEPVQTADVLPTLLELAGVAAPEGLDGRSLLGAVRNSERPQWPVISEVTAAAYEPGADPLPEGAKTETLIQSVTLGGWKLVRQATGALELYDLAADPRELTNRAPTEPERVLELSGRLEELVSAAAERGQSFERAAGVHLDDEQLRELEALGYLDKQQ